MAYSELPWRPFLAHQAWSWTTLRRGNFFITFINVFFILSRFYVFWRFLFLFERFLHLRLTVLAIITCHGGAAQSRAAALRCWTRLHGRSLSPSIHTACRRTGSTAGQLLRMRGASRPTICYVAGWLAMTSSWRHCETGALSPPLFCRPELSLTA